MRLKQNEEGVSEPVGYLLILGVIISALAVLIVFSSPIVEQGRETANFNNMQAGFSTLKTDIDLVALNSSPIRTTKLNLASGNIYVDPKGTVTKNNITIFVNGNKIYNSTMGIIVYTLKDKKLIYECGGVIESYSTGMLFRENPKINVDRTFGGNNTLISIMKVTGNFSSISGEGVAQVIITNPRYNETFNSGTSEVSNLTLTINSVYAGAWKKYLSDLGFEILSNSQGQVSARIRNTRVIIGEHQIDVRVR